MNDFTIDELDDMLAGLGHVLERVADEEPIIKLQNKIQSMIDNYCEPNPNKPNFTQDQKNFICYQIGHWYLMMKPLLEVQHNLGYMKEKLKLMACDDEMPENC